MKCILKIVNEFQSVYLTQWYYSRVFILFQTWKLNLLFFMVSTCFQFPHVLCKYKNLFIFSNWHISGISGHEYSWESTFWKTRKKFNFLTAENFIINYGNFHTVITNFIIFHCGIFTVQSPHLTFLYSTFLQTM